jgi:hypothetical protein
MGVLTMKMLNYDGKYLIMSNLRQKEVSQAPTTYTKRQYQILCNLIIRKKITKQFFEFINEQLFGTTDWKKLDYSEMYLLIYVLTNWNYEKERI